MGPDHPDSNFILADDLLFKPMAVRAENIHRLKGELPQAEAVAAAIHDLQRVTQGTGELDLVLLGMGEDGHVASLFPNASEAVIRHSPQFLAINNSPKPPPERLSLSFVALKSAKEVWVLASGSGKEVALKESLQEGSPRTPLARVLQSRKDTLVFTDIKLG